MVNERVMAVIPARGGSKGIKDKNIKPILGVPMIGRVIRTLKESLAFVFLFLIQLLLLTTIHWQH